MTARRMIASIPAIVIAVVVAVPSLTKLAVAAVSVAPATPEANAAARDAVRTAFSSPEALRRGALTSRAVMIGPRLWAASSETRTAFRNDTKDVYGVVGPQFLAHWKLAPLDVASVPDAVRPVLAEAAKTGTPVLCGAIMTHGETVLPEIVLAQVKPEEFPFSVRKPTDAEIEYYFGLVFYELGEPIWVVESRAHAFLCHFGDDGRLIFFEML